MNTIQLYPEYKKYERLHGIYLDDPLLSAYGDSTVVYSNFLSSLDGRIAVSENRQWLLPNRLTSKADHRLFLELQAQADCIITHGGYLRSLAAGRLSNILHVGQPKEYADLADWRARQQLPAQPLVVVCSNTLDFPIPHSLAKEDVWIATSECGNRDRLHALRQQGYKTIRAGDKRVEGGALTEQLSRAGYRRLYLCAGAELFESCLSDRCINLHYMTLSMQFIGHTKFLTMLGGDSNLKHCRLQLARLIFNQEPDEKNNPAVDQLYLTFNVRYRGVPIADRPSI